MKSLSPPERISTRIQNELSRLAGESDPLHLRGVRELQLGLRACETAVLELVPEILAAQGFALAPARTPPGPMGSMTAGLTPPFDMDGAIAAGFARLDVRRLIGAQRYTVRGLIIEHVLAALPGLVATHLPPLVSPAAIAVHAAAQQSEYIKKLGPREYPTDEQRSIDEQMAAYRRQLHRMMSSPSVAENMFTRLIEQVRGMETAAASLFLDDEGAVTSFLDTLAAGEKRKGIFAPRQMRASSQGGPDPVADAFPGAAPSPTKIRYR